MAEKKYTDITEKDQVTDAMVEATAEIISGWYQGKRINWNDVVDRLDGMELEDGSTMDLGADYRSPAIKEIIRRYRKGDY
jgi:hypothetical protein